MSRNPYYEHDDRGDNRRAMGRNRKYPARNRPQNGGRFQPQDDDVVMTSNAAGGSWNNERRFNPYKNQKHSGKRRRDKNRGGGGGGRNRQFGKNETYDSSEGNWFKITVPCGQKFGKQFILKSIHSNCRDPFVPFNYHTEGNCAIFYVDGYDVASMVKDVNQKITFPNGFKMRVFSAKSGIPVSAMDEEAAEKIKACMSNRYDVPSHSLNLRKFHHEPELQQNGLYVPLHKPNVMNSVVKTITEHIPELEILDLGDNRLHSLDALNPLVSVCNQLVSLNLEKNKLRSVNELNAIKGMNVMSLVLDGNPLCDDFKDKTAYISAIRERLPKLMKLDGHDLPAPIGFDLGSETLPPSKGSYFGAEDLKALVVNFLEQYYTIYDSGDREKLLDAYHDQANFSLTVVFTKFSGPKQANQPSLQHYIPDSRNLLKIQDSNLRYRLLRQGRLAVVSVLTQLPQTQHDPHSFSIDIFFVAPGFMIFSVTGVFKEVSGNHDAGNHPLRTFHRTFVVSAQGSGFVVVNETLYISNATMEQVKSFKFPAPTPSPSPAPVITERSPNEKEQLAIEFAKVTGMNLDFSAKCLEENDWDHQKAFMVFNELNSMGKIPPEAFMMMN